MLFTLVHWIIQPTLDRGAPWMVQPMLIYNPRNINTGAQPPTAITIQPQNHCKHFNDNTEACFSAAVKIYKWKIISSK